MLSRHVADAGAALLVIAALGRFGVHLASRVTGAVAIGQFFLRLVHLLRADSDSLHAALVDRMQDLPPELMRSITWDQSTEMARHPRRR